MYNSHVFAVSIVLASAVNCFGADFLLSVKEVKGATPKIERHKDVLLTEVGWLPVASADSETLQIGRQIEIVVSTGTEFHLRVKDRGELIELKGRVRKSEEGSSFTPTVINTGKQSPDFVIEVEYRHHDPEDHGFVYVRTSIPVRFGRTFCLGSGVSGVPGFPATLWSLEKMEPSCLPDRDTSTVSKSASIKSSDGNPR